MPLSRSPAAGVFPACRNRLTTVVGYKKASHERRFSVLVRGLPVSLAQQSVIFVKDRYGGRLVLLYTYDVLTVLGAVAHKYDGFVLAYAFDGSDGMQYAIEAQLPVLLIWDDGDLLEFEFPARIVLKHDGIVVVRIQQDVHYADTDKIAALLVAETCFFFLIYVHTFLLAAPQIFAIYL